jgi:hypothetical protein
MPKWSIRDLWGKRTENKGLNPGMREMLASLDGVYDPRAPASANQLQAEAVSEEEGSQSATS